MERETPAKALETCRPWTVLIADDSDYVRQWLAQELRRLFPQAGTIHDTGDVREAIKMAASLQPSLVLMDIDFAGETAMSGIDAADAIWKNNPACAILIVSNYKSEVYVRHLYRVTPADSAYGYVLKDRVSQTLEDAVSCVLGGDCWIDPDITRIVTRLIQKDRTLTDNEYEVLACIALGYSDHTSATLLCITEKAIQARLRGVYGKFGIPPKGQAGSGQFSPRNRAVWQALKGGLITEPALRSWEERFMERAEQLGVALT